MADGFDDPNLFAEFDKIPERTDKILMQKFDGSNKNQLATDVNDGEPKEEVDSDVRDDFSEGSDDWNLSDGEIETETTNTLNGKIGSRVTDSSATSEIAKLQSEIQRLRKECERWKKHSRIISTNKYGKMGEGPALQVVYMNNTVASRHRPLVEEFMSGLILQELAQQSKDNPADRLRRSCVNLEQTDAAPTPDEKIHQIKASTVIGCSQMYTEFIIDSMGWSLTMNNPSISEGWFIPYYTQVFFIALPEDEDDEDACPQKKNSRPKASCWNCEGNHNLSDCKQPYNKDKVSANRRKFQQEKGNRNNTPGRYHGDEPKFAVFKPGQISGNLREAMGLKDNQLPLYIYNMRNLGYPPGHLQALQEHGSGLSMFDKHGQEVSLDGEAGEDGEVDTASPSDNYIDVTKLIDYPGFNVVKPKDVKDESHKLNLPSFRSRDSKEKMAEELSSKNRGVKRSHDDNRSHRKRNRREDRKESSVDMDISDSGTPSRKRKSVGGSQDSLDDLEAQKALIEQQLALAEGSDADVQVVDSADDSFVPPLPPTPVRPPPPDSTPPVTPTPATPTGARTSFLGTPSDSAVFKTPDNTRLLRTPSTGGSLAMSLGTPISERVATVTPNKGLPDPEKFSDGIQQDIPFENLPGTEGTFERMQNLLKHLRSRQDS